MATGKRYYWIKLKDSFMSSDEIDYLMSQPDGANYVVLYQMLCLKTINTNGCLVSKIGEMLIPYDAEKIQRECKWFPLSTVRLALTVYKQIGLIFENPDGTDTIAADQSIALTYAGEFQCTAYCSEEYPHICGEGQGITSSGAKVQPGVTVAADTSIFPYGTVILIEGVGMRVVQDTGSLIKENALDVAVGTHAEAISWSGWGSHKVWIVTGGETDAAE